MDRTFRKRDSFRTKSIHNTIEKRGILAQNDIMRIFYYNNNNEKSMLPLELKRLTFFELTFVLKGKIIYYIDGKKIELHAGDALFVKLSRI